MSRFRCILFPVDALLIKGEPLWVISYRVDMKGQSFHGLLFAGRGDGEVLVKAWGCGGGIELFRRGREG